MICEVAPELPSEILSRSSNLLPQYSGSPDRFAEARGTTRGQLRSALRGGLDNIVMKALQKRPEQRYGSVHELQEDISRYLRGEEVSAPTFAGEAVSPRHFDEPADSTPSAKRIAVLPFKFHNLGPATDTDDRFLGLGLADALITRLSKVRRFVVRPTSSVLSFREDVIDPITAGRELKVDYIIDGNIKKAGNRLRVSVQLLDVAENAAVWAASIDESLTDVFTLEDTISSKLIEALLPQLTGNDLEEFYKRGTEDPEATEAFFQRMADEKHFCRFTRPSPQIRIMPEPIPASRIITTGSA